MSHFFGFPAAGTEQIPVPGMDVSLTVLSVLTFLACISYLLFWWLQHKGWYVMNRTAFFVLTAAYVIVSVLAILLLFRGSG